MATGVATTKGKKGRVRKSDERKVQVGVEAELRTHLSFRSASLMKYVIDEHQQVFLFQLLV